ncbi:MAG: hypothetical protein Q4A78_06255 [Peptostreptococcaceae bacterium]|nr:hypothetical protein [Peptostreptococcaceae bacterium]
MKGKIVEKRRRGFCRAAGFVLFMLLTLLPLSSQALTDKPIVDAEHKVIYAKGFPLRLTWGGGDKTRVEYQKSENNHVALDLEPETPEMDDTKNLREWTIYGGAKEEDVSSTSIFVEKGFVKAIYGGGDKGDVQGDTQIIFREGTVKYLYGGGKNGDVKGDARIIVEEVSTLSITEKMDGGGEHGRVEGKRLGYLQRNPKQDSLIKVAEDSFSGILLAEKEGQSLHWRTIGDASLPKDETRQRAKSLRIREVDRLMIPEGSSLTLEGNLEVNGTMTLNGTVDVAGKSVKGSGRFFYSDLTPEDIEIEESPIFYTGKGIEPRYTFRDRKVEGIGKPFRCDWSETGGFKVEYRNNVNVGTATMTLKKEGGTALVSRDFEIQKSKAGFRSHYGIENIHTFNKGQKTSDFTYGDQITVKFTLETSALRRGAAVPFFQPNQVALFLKEGDQYLQISEAVEAGFGQEIELVHDTKDKQLQKGENDVYVKYEGTDNAEGHEEKVKIILHPLPLRARVISNSPSSSKIYDRTTGFENVVLELIGELDEDEDEISAAVDGDAEDFSAGSDWRFIPSEDPVLDGGDIAQFYSLEKGNVTGTVTISPRELEVSWFDLEFDYDGKEHGPKAVFADSAQILQGDEAQLSLEVRGFATKVGRYTAEAVLIGGASENYRIRNPKAEFEIRRATDPITPPPQPPSPSPHPEPPIPIPDPYVPSPQPPKEPEKPQEEPETVEWEPRENTPIDKVWAIRLSLPLDPETLEEKNVYIEALHEPGKAIEAELELSEDKRSIHIRPMQSFAYGRAYRLHIRNLKTEDGRKLKNNVSMIFRTLTQ